MLIVLILPSILFPPKPDRRTGGRAVGDTTPRSDTGPAALAAPAPPESIAATASLQSGCPAVRPSRVAAAETVWVVSPRVRFGFSTAGAQLLSAELLDYKSFAPGDSSKPVQLVPPGRPLEWAGIKSKYFLTAALALEENQPRFGGGIAVGGPITVTTSSLFSGRAGVATRTTLALTLPVPPSGEFRYELYAGPLEYRRLARLGHDLDDANPYGGIFRPIIQPVSILVVNILIWMHDRLSLAYGWVLVIFGVLVRALLWPLNQKAMESSIRMQAVAPLLKETQERYKAEPERLQRETMRLYKEHNVNPLGGCLPMLIPMPVLFALFFVFANTIEFRGVAFLWLPDLSRADPYYIIPVVMGLSMFVLSKVGQIGVPPNPQTETMLHFMPVFMTLLLLRFASGLNLYYAVSNIFSIPQQYLIARRRLREQGRRT